jgi:glyoxylase-like metal-dependent hydrolase (beta-lactamase superfamily II)/rhodanese-related sulfurtransferase
MTIEQFEDKGLAHFSYAVMSEGEIAVIDPGRDPRPYYEYAMLHDARIVAVVETHPHADFVSSHLEISQTKEAEIYASQLSRAAYPHTTFDDGDFFQIAELTLHALNTPGHSPDSICVLVKDADQQARALFSGDTLFIGDVGRPDLREQAAPPREALARDLYRSIREKIMPLPDEVLLYPSHGAGSLCGKSLSNARSSTIGEEKRSNPALQPMTEAAFVDFLLADQPFVPLYFPYDVNLNKHGAPVLRDSLRMVPHLAPNFRYSPAALLVDTRPAATFRQGHLPRALNIQDDLKFETWLGAIIGPTEMFYLVAGSEASLQKVIAKTAKIGYEPHIKGAVVQPQGQTETSPHLNLEDFKNNPDRYTVVDVRNREERQEQPLLARSLNIPLPELRRRAPEIPTSKPIVVHCASGYRSAAGTSILAALIKQQPVYDLGEKIKDFIGL